MPRIFLTTYAIANEHGAACGEWVDADEDFGEALDRIGAAYGDPTHEEPMIADHEGWNGIDPANFPIDELAELAELIEERGDDVAALISVHGSHNYGSADDLRRAVENASFTWGNSESDAADELAEAYGVLESIPEHLRYYFDTEKWADDAVMGGDLSQVSIGGRVCFVQSN